MHFAVLVVTKEKPTEAIITRALDRCRRHWDWFQIGGRWTGYFDGYNPAQDPDNIEVCSYCKGTGKRTDDVGNKARAMNPDYTCNVCNGTGKHTKWPTEWAPHGGDSVQVKDLPKYHQLQPTYAVIKNGQWNDGDFGFSRSGFNAGGQKEADVWFAEQLKDLSPEDYITIVDCHN